MATKPGRFTFMKNDQMVCMCGYCDENRDAPGGYSQKEYAIKKKEYETVDSPILWKEVI